ncbi:hypothetical protein TNCV_2922221 [Trichonephila clavipes]|nr:hypothetical protein TNCV_2922221 [Trichonephila clavipes]
MPRLHETRHYNRFDANYLVSDIKGNQLENTGRGRYKENTRIKDVYERPMQLSRNSVELTDYLKRGWHGLPHEVMDDLVDSSVFRLV